MKDYLLTFLLLFCIYLLTSCAPCKVTTITEKERIVHTDTFFTFVPEYHRDTVTYRILGDTIIIEKGNDNILQTSFLENKYAYSFANLTYSGKLSHSLTMKKDSVKITYKYITVYKDREVVKVQKTPLLKVLSYFSIGFIFGLAVCLFYRLLRL